jgi:hypothetical protein
VSFDAAYWDKVRARGSAVPTDRPLDDLTAELVEMLGSTDPHVRDDLAFTVLTRWITQGTYDDRLTGLGDALCANLTMGLGEDGTDSVFRRSFSVLPINAILGRDRQINALHADTVLRWADAGLHWYASERDLRGYIPGKGWAHAAAHGADLVRALARSRHVDEGRLMLLLDTIADRVLAPTATTLCRPRTTGLPTQR